MNVRLICYKVVVVAEIFKVVVECSPSVRIGVLFAMFSLSSFRHITFSCANATSSGLSTNQVLKRKRHTIG